MRSKMPSHLFRVLFALLLVSGCGKGPKSGDITAASPDAKGQPAKNAPFVKVPLGLSDDLNIPADNPMTPEKVDLGRLLYFDRRMSKDATISCATCHDPAKGWSDNRVVSTGIHGKVGVRNAPTVVNSTYMGSQFWDGRAKGLEDQALGPIINPVEMGMGSHEDMIASLNKVQAYRPLFQKVFGDPTLTKERVVQAIASFERTILSGNSRYDRFNAGDTKALNESETRGKDVFFGKGKCLVCHSGPNFSDSLFHNLGVGMSRPNPDLGRFVESKVEKDKGAFKTPTLRDLNRTAPYMHDGSQKTLEEVVEFYDKGGEANTHLDPLVTPLHLSTQDKADLVAFMKALNGEPYPMVKEPTPPN